MMLGIALGLLQAAAPAAAAPLALTCRSADAAAPATFAFQIDLAGESFTVAKNGAAPQRGVAQSFGDRIVLELPSGNPEAVPMFFLNTADRTYREATRSGASAITVITAGTCGTAGSGS